MTARHTCKVKLVHTRHIRSNLLANLFGQGWSALMALVFVPFYLHFIGASGFGLIGFFMTLSALLVIMDGGLGATVTREAVAYPLSTGADRRNLADMLRTVEVLFLLIALVIGIGLVALSPVLADSWLHVPPEKYPDVSRGLTLAGIAIALQFPLAFYTGCWIGLQRQVSLNVVNAISTTCRGGGAVLLLWLYSPTVTVFFAWQCVASALTLSCFHVLVWKSLGSPKARFQLGSIHRTGRFTAGVGLINVLGLLLTQLDKVILSRLLSLESFGYYMIAWSAGTLTLRATGPVFNTYYPRIAQLADGHGSNSDLQDTYLQAAGLLSVAVVPATLVLAFFGHTLLFAWTGSQVAANSASLPLTLISIGTMCNAFMHLPYALQLAHKKTRLSLVQNLVAAALFPILTITLVRQYGLQGAAWPWLLLNIGYMLFSAPLAYRKLLDSARKPWYLKCVLTPMALAITVVLPLFACSIVLNAPIEQIFLAVAAFAASFAACIWNTGWKQVSSLWLKDE
ncbi:lipopolysaccharide biosynthesis protein [Dyella choica]|uniref:Polysaccharide biosynthesis protein n=1 Tax=Dyella choica TaxID=1927959 RepID=A0A3S0PJC0_9GAMM|nr:oligosaccharide flippase family protein [Dyella choica]RUL76748.1 polysaccharide biosynthesis protein [Dyella choica]